MNCMIGYWNDTVVCRLSVCLSVCLSVSVTMFIVALKAGVGGCTVVFLGGDFLFTSFDTVAVTCII